MIASLRAFTLAFIILLGIGHIAARADIVTDLVGTWQVEFSNGTSEWILEAPDPKTGIGHLQIRQSSSTSVTDGTWNIEPGRPSHVWRDSLAPQLFIKTFGNRYQYAIKSNEGHRMILVEQYRTEEIMCQKIAPR